MACTPPKRDLRGTTLLSGHAMTIDYQITFGEILSEGALARAKQIVELTFDEVNALFNPWNPKSELSYLNQLPAGEKVLPSPPLYALLTLVDKLVHISHGRYDPTIEPLRKLWIAHLKQGAIPEDSKILQLAEAIGWQKVHLQDGFFWKDHDHLEITLDSISKGLCVDMLLERLRSNGFPDLLVEWGGELRATGQHTEGRPWRIFVRSLNSENPEDALTQIDLHEEAVATSGDYLQYWTVDGSTYFHIFDAEHLCPLTIRQGSVASTTVLAPTCAVADALATTALCLETIETASAWIKEVQAIYPETTFWLTSRQ